MVTTNLSNKVNIIRKLEDTLQDFGKNVFKVNKKIPIEIADSNLDKIIFGDVYSPLSYKDGKIYIKSGYLNFILDKYKENPELITELLKGLAHEYVHALLDTDIKKDEVKENLIAHEGLATLVGDLYKQIGSEKEIKLNKNFEEILKDLNSFVIGKIKDKEYLNRLDKQLKEKYNENLNKELDKISEIYKKCVEIDPRNPGIFDLRENAKYITVYKIPSLILQKEYGLQKILENIPKRIGINEYQNKIFEEFENLENKEMIRETLICLEDKFKKQLEYLENLVTTLESLIPDSKLKEIK